MNENRLVIPLDKIADLQMVENTIKAKGVSILEALMVGNYHGAGPHLILTIDGFRPPGFIESIQETVRTQPEKSKATFFTLISPNGIAYKVGVDDAGNLHTTEV